MNTKQIAAEAAEQIETDVSDVIIDKALLTGIIQSAIEKAVSIAKDEWNEADYIANNDPTSRVAHASEQRCPGPRQHGHPLVYESHCDHGETKPHIVKPAHASEPKFGQEPTLVPIEHCILEVDSPCFPAGWGEYLQCGCHRCLEYIRRYILSLEKMPAHASELPANPDKDHPERPAPAGETG